MAVFQLLNVLTGAVEGTKYNATGLTNEIWALTIPATLANGDTILGPVIPAGTYLSSITIDAAPLDTANGILAEVGYVGHLAAFFANGSTIFQSGLPDVLGLNVPGSIGFTAATDTQVVITITHAATTPQAGRVAMSVNYLASP